MYFVYTNEDGAAPLPLELEAARREPRAHLRRQHRLPMEGRHRGASAGGGAREPVS